ncbi:MAG TPA: hypothetical protein VF719_09195, partial [Abditibacteriaceae bacterium]
MLQPASAAPRQIVLVVAEGLNPQTIELGNAYLKKAYEADDAPSFDQLKVKGKPQNIGADALASFRGLLATAATNGYRTGIVTTGDVTKVAPLFYGISADTTDLAGAIVDAKFDFIAGGGRSHFLPQGIAGSTRADAIDLGQKLKAAGGTPYFDVDSLENESTGKVLALQ